MPLIPYVPPPQIAVPGVDSAFLTTFSNQKNQQTTTFNESDSDGILRSVRGKFIVGKNSPYEIFSMAIAETDSELKFLVTSNLPLEGKKESRATAGYVGYGDILIYPKGDHRENYALRFAPQGKNTPGVGIYKNVVASNNSSRHFGIKTQASYLQQLTKAGGDKTEFRPAPQWVTGMKTGKLVNPSISVSQERSSSGQYLISIAVQKKDLPEELKKSIDFSVFLPLSCLNDYVIGDYSLLPPPSEELMTQAGDILNGGPLSLVSPSALLGGLAGDAVIPGLSSFLSGYWGLGALAGIPFLFSGSSNPAPISPVNVAGIPYIPESVVGITPDPAINTNTITTPIPVPESTNVTTVPESTTILGSLLALGFGAFLRKRK